MRKIAWFLVAAVALSSCGIIGGSTKEDELKSFCDRARTASDAGVLTSLDGSESADQLRAYASTQDAVDYLADHAPTRIEQPTKDFVAAYDELVAELTTAGFDVTKVDEATLTGINQRLDAARADMEAVFTGPCDLTAAP